MKPETLTEFGSAWFYGTRGYNTYIALCASGDTALGGAKWCFLPIGKHGSTATPSTMTWATNDGSVLKGWHPVEDEE